MCAPAGVRGAGISPRPPVQARDAPPKGLNRSVPLGRPSETREGPPPSGNGPSGERSVVSRLERGALVFLVAGGVAAARRGWVVRLALEVLGDAVVLDHEPARVLVGLEVGEEGVAPRDHARLVEEVLQVAVDAGVEHPSAAAIEPVLELHAADQDGVLPDGDVLEALALDVALDPYRVGDERRVPLDLDRPLDLRPVQPTRGALRYPQVVNRRR